MIFVVLLSNTVCSQIEFFNYYSDNGVDKGQGIVQLEDSSYVITGASSSFFNGSSQAFLMKIDSLGNRIWSNSYGGSGSESGRRVLYMKDFGFFICGYTSSIGNGGFDNYLAKIDDNGNLEWERSYGDFGWEKVHDAAFTKDTGVIMVGESNSNVSNNKDIYLVRTNIDGDTVWTKTIGGVGDDWASDVLPVDDTSYIIVGRMFDEDSLLTKVWASRIHEDGSVFWEKSFGVIDNSWGNSIAPYGTEFRIVGGSEGESCDGIDSYNCVITRNGDFWGEYVSHMAGDREYTEIVNDDSAITVFALIRQIEPWLAMHGEDLNISRFSSSFVWQDGVVIGNFDDDVSGECIYTLDGGFINVGYSSNMVSGGNDIYVCKIGPNNEYPDYLGSAGINNLVTIFEEENPMTDLQIFPNPSSGFVNIQVPNEGVDRIIVLDLKGIVILEKFGSNSIDLSSLSDGYYILQITSAEFTATKKVLIQH